MATRLNPYLSFDGTARAALEFYRDLFGGELSVSTYGDMGAETDTDRVMHGLLETDQGFTLMASDAPPGTEHRSGTDMAVSISGDDAELLDRYWQGLSTDGQVSVPLEKQPWGDRFGACIDRFGVSWMIDIVAS